MMRPTTFEGFLEAGSRFVTAEGYAKGLAFQPDPTDVFIAPYSKCGTTWMQQIVHGLRTGGDLNFSEITEVVPWIELAHDIGIDPQQPQVARPRAFKSHLRWDEIPKGGKYIVVLRDPVDAFVSLFKFMQGWFFEPGAISLHQFADHVLNRPDEESYWGHAISWVGQRENPDVLLVAFEDMKRDLPSIVRKVASFIGLDPDPDRLDIATRQAGFDFMKAHQHLFDDNLVHRMRDPACGLPPDSASTKVNSGQVGGAAGLVTDDMRAAFEQKWHDTLGAQFGLPDYASLRAMLADDTDQT